MKVKILFDPDGAYGYPKGTIIDAKKFVKDFCAYRKDDELVYLLNKANIEAAIDFVADAWSIEYEVIPDDKVRKCSICGKLIDAGYMFDGMECFCSEDCAVEFFDGDVGCVEILLDDGDRLSWHESFPKREHYRANIGNHSPSCFHHFDNEREMFAWISNRIGQKVSSFDDCEDWSRKKYYENNEQGSYIEILCIENLRDFYHNRQEYVMKLRECSDCMDKVQRMKKSPRRDFFFYMFSRAYDEANNIFGTHPEVWQGEI